MQLHNELELTTPIVLAGKPRIMREPALDRLELIIHYYNALAHTEDPHRRVFCVNQLVLLLIGKTININAISADELVAFLEKIPTACGLEKSEPNSDTDDKGFDYVYGHLASCFSWTMTDIKKMTMSDIKRFIPYLESHPPVHLLVAAGLGFEKKSQDSLQSQVKSIVKRAKALAKGR